MGEQVTGQCNKKGWPSIVCLHIPKEEWWWAVSK